MNAAPRAAGLPPFSNDLHSCVCPFAHFTSPRGAREARKGSVLDRRALSFDGNPPAYLEESRNVSPRLCRQRSRSKSVDASSRETTTTNDDQRPESHAAEAPSRILTGFNGNRRVPTPVNEAVKSYAPGSPERAALKGASALDVQ